MAIYLGNDLVSGGGGSGGSKLYRHNISMVGILGIPPDGGAVMCAVTTKYTSSPTPLTLNDLVTSVSFSGNDIPVIPLDNALLLNGNIDVVGFAKVMFVSEDGYDVVCYLDNNASGFEHIMAFTGPSQLQLRDDVMEV